MGLSICRGRKPLFLLYQASEQKELGDTVSTPLVSDGGHDSAESERLALRNKEIMQKHGVGLSLCLAVYFNLDEISNIKPALYSVVIENVGDNVTTESDCSHSRLNKKSD